jgi:uncharacterized integral membrane protein
MSHMDGTDSASPGQSPEAKAKSRGAKALAGAVLLIILVVFVIRNSGRVRLDFIVTSGHPRLIWLILGCVLIGTAFGYFLGRPPSSRSSRSAHRKTGKGGPDLP